MNGNIVSWGRAIFVTFCFEICASAQMNVFNEIVLFVHGEILGLCPKVKSKALPLVKLNPSFNPTKSDFITK